MRPRLGDALAFIAVGMSLLNGLGAAVFTDYSPGTIFSIAIVTGLASIAIALGDRPG
jgi:hypothetical protein